MWIFILIVVIILLPYIVMSICSTLIYCYEAINTPCKELESQYPTLIFGLGMFLRTMTCAIAAVTLRPLGWLPRKKPSPWNPDSSLQHPPIVLVHGLYHNSSAWMLLGGRLEKAGYVVSPFSYSSFFTTFDEIVSRLNDHIYLLEASYPGKKPILIGHSMGGLIIRAWLMDKENKQRSSAVITMATPHKGSKLAALGPGSMSKNLLPESELLGRLQKDKTPDPVPCIAFCSNADELVLPTANLLPPDGWQVRMVKRVSHLGILLSRSISGVLIETLRKLSQPENIVAEPANINSEIDEESAQDTLNGASSQDEQPLQTERPSHSEKAVKPSSTAARSKNARTAAMKKNTQVDEKTPVQNMAAEKKVSPKKAVKTETN